MAHGERLCCVGAGCEGISGRVKIKDHGECVYIYIYTHTFFGPQWLLENHLLDDLLNHVLFAESIWSHYQTVTSCNFNFLGGAGYSTSFYRKFNPLR